MSQEAAKGVEAATPILSYRGQGVSYVLFTTLAALSLIQSASQPDQGLVPPYRWTVDYSHAACTLARRVGAERSPIVVLHAPLGMEPGQFLVMDGGAGLDPQLTGELEVRLDEGSPLTVRARREERSGNAVIRFTPIPEDFLDRVAEASRLSVAKQGQTILALSFNDARDAVDALGRCNDDLLQSWGIDLAARRSLSRRPRVTNFDWTFEVAPFVETFVVLAANVSDRGRPLDCRVVYSSGNRRLDAAVCRGFRARARLEPGLDSQGRPVRAQFVTSVRWTIHESRPPSAR